MGTWRSARPPLRCRQPTFTMLVQTAAVDPQRPFASIDINAGPCPLPVIHTTIRLHHSCGVWFLADPDLRWPNGGARGSEIGCENGQGAHRVHSGSWEGKAFPSLATTSGIQLATSRANDRNC